MFQKVQLAMLYPFKAFRYRDSTKTQLSNSIIMIHQAKTPVLSVALQGPYYGDWLGSEIGLDKLILAVHVSVIYDSDSGDGTDDNVPLAFQSDWESDSGYSTDNSIIFNFLITSEYLHLIRELFTEQTAHEQYSPPPHKWKWRTGAEACRRTLNLKQLISALGSELISAVTQPEFPHTLKLKLQNLNKYNKYHWAKEGKYSRMTRDYTTLSKKDNSGSQVFVMWSQPSSSLQ
ncbi:hypothetical protein C8J56DRAFT_884042 [Mycena floridula]|nr:hypothetical protein C8J56DRAFT_884042 [Mycena floridula]